MLTDSKEKSAGKKKSTENKKIFFGKNVCVFYKIYIICRKKNFYMEKNSFYWKNINENVKNISHFRNIFLHRICLCYKQNINLS